MRAIPNHTKHALPWSHNRRLARRRTAGSWPLQAEQVHGLDLLLHEVHPDAPRLDADRLAELARWLLAIPEEQARAVLEERLAWIGPLRALLDDPDWDCSDGNCARISKLLAYVDRADNVIPADVPVIGRMDDALLLELAWPAIRVELDEYEDFCSHREATRSEGSGAARREAWVRDRLAELALLRLKERIHQGHYTGGGKSGSFRIGS